MSPRSRRLDSTDEPVVRCSGGRDADAREQLGHRERLLDVVVRTEVERLDLDLVLVPGREHDDRRLAQERAQPADRLAAVDAGQAEVEQDHVGRLRRCPGDGLLAARSRRDRVAVRLERDARARSTDGSSSQTRIR